MSDSDTWKMEINGKISDLLECFQRREKELTQFSDTLEKDRKAIEEEMRKKRQEHETFIKEQYRELDETRLRIENEKKRMQEVQEFQSSPVHLNIGGHRFTTSLQTLRRDIDSMLATMFS